MPIFKDVRWFSSPLPKTFFPPWTFDFRCLAKLQSESICVTRPPSIYRSLRQMLTSINENCPLSLFPRKRFHVIKFYALSSNHLTLYSFGFVDNAFSSYFWTSFVFFLHPTVNSKNCNQKLLYILREIFFINMSLFLFSFQIKIHDEYVKELLEKLNF